MFEFTISCDENLNILSSIYLRLKSVVDNLNGIIIKQNSQKVDSVCLAVEENYKAFVKANILDAVSDAIISVYKHDYLSEHICINIRNAVAYNSFIQALVVFDRQTDKDIIKKNLILEDKLNIDSFYNFRLEQLKNRWHDIACVVNDSIPVMLKDKSVADITRYFVDSTSKEVKEVHLFAQENSIQIKVDGVLSDLEFDTNTDYLNNILTEIISISPQKVILHGKLDKYKDLQDSLLSVFVDNVFVVN